MKKRVISAIVALALCVPIVYIGGDYFKILVLVLSSLGFREFLKLDNSPKLMQLMAYVCFIMMIFVNLDNKQFDGLVNTDLLMMTFLIFCFASLIYHKSYTTDGVFKLLGGTLFLSFSFSLFAIIRNISLPLFIYLFSITIFTDTFAHAVGTVCGKHKVNEISPNKSWEGYIGGTIMGVLLGVITYMIVADPYVNIINLIVLTTILSVVGQLGDLFFSQIKRNHNIKDFSNIMPGHGGILDRLDSIILVMIAFSFLNFLL